MVISFFYFFTPFFLFSLDLLFNLLDTLSSLCIRDAGIELALNAINFPLVGRFCLILNNPFLIITVVYKSHNQDTWGASDSHTFFYSHKLVSSDTPNIVT